MANRAYLWSHDPFEYGEEQEWPAPRVQEDIPYYDSRWVIPFAWFFFFVPSDLKMVQVRYRQSAWQEVKCYTDKQGALQVFARRQKTLWRLLPSQYNATPLLARFLRDILTRPGSQLLMDPQEIFGGFIPETEEENLLHCAKILHTLDVPDVQPAQIMATIGSYSTFTFKDADDFALQAFGYTYW